METIGNAAFADCVNLTSMTFNAKLKNMGENILQDCTKLTNVVIPEGVTKISIYAFKNTAIASITLPSTLKEIGSNAFAKCVNLTAIDLKNVTTIGNNVFEHCEKLTDVKMGKVEIVASYAFRWCYALKTIDLSAAKEVQDDAFEGCKSLESVTFGTKLTLIDAGAFCNCVKLKNITYAGNMAGWAKVNIGILNKAIREATITCKQ